MKANNEFWIRRWAENRIGFHTRGVQPLLERFWDEIPTGPGRVLVPLCGKTDDMIWLAARGHEIVGVDLSEIAARAFDAENGLALRVEDDPPFIRMQGERIEFLVGDFFDLTPATAGRFNRVYDRAALIALPREVRLRYASRLQKLLEKDAHMLLIKIDYDQSEMNGPPYAVGEAEVRELFHGLRIEKLYEHDCLEDEPRFRERGLSWMSEAVYHLQAAAAPVSSS